MRNACQVEAADGTGRRCSSLYSSNHRVCDAKRGAPGFLMPWKDLAGRVNLQVGSTLCSSLLSLSQYGLWCQSSTDHDEKRDSPGSLMPWKELASRVNVPVGST